MTVIQIFGLLLAISVLILLVFKGANSLTASVTAALIAGLSNGLGIWEILADNYVNGFIAFFGQMMIMFILSTIYGRVMAESYSAHKIAYACIDLLGEKNVILVIGLTTAILVYGGVSAMVVVFTVLPFAIILFEQANLPKILLPSIITWGQATFAMGSLPGSPQLANVIPSLYFGTKPTAAAVSGIISGLTVLVLGYLYLHYQAKAYAKKGIGYDPSSKINLQIKEQVTRESCPSTIKAFLPVILLLVVYIALANGRLGVEMSSTNAVNTALFTAIVSVFVMHPKKFSKIKAGAVEASMGWAPTLVNFASVVAFGSVVQATPGFAHFVDFALSMPGNSYVSAAVSVSLLCGITGSASGGLTITMNTLADQWMATNVNPASLHRICAIASTGFDSLPHCGGVVTVSNLCNEPIRGCYRHIFVTTTVIPVISLVITVVLASVGVV